jgi:hypothetical protein
MKKLSHDSLFFLTTFAHAALEVEEDTIKKCRAGISLFTNKDLLNIMPQNFKDGIDVDMLQKQLAEAEASKVRSYKAVEELLGVIPEIKGYLDASLQSFKLNAIFKETKAWSDAELDAARSFHSFAVENAQYSRDQTAACFFDFDGYMAKRESKLKEKADA